jgi:hypothetical protein
MGRRAIGLRGALAIAIALALSLPHLAAAQDQEEEQDQAQVQDDCTCLWHGSFSEVQDRADIVVAGSVVQTKGNALDLAIERRLRGEPYLDEIRIWLKTRNYCRPLIDDFPVGSRWVMALAKIREVPEDWFDPSTPNQSYGRPDDYILSACGGYWLSYVGDAVTGNLIDAPRWAHEIDMQPVMISVVEAFVRGDMDADALREAAKEDPAVDNLLLDTKAFLRGDVPLEEPR